MTFKRKKITMYPVDVLYRTPDDDRFSSKHAALKNNKVSC